MEHFHDHNHKCRFQAIDSKLMGDINSFKHSLKQKLQPNQQPTCIVIKTPCLPHSSLIEFVCTPTFLFAN